MAQEGSKDQIDQQLDDDQMPVPESDATGNESAAARSGSAEPGNAGDEADLAASLEAARAEIEALKDQALRSQAESENVRRRAARDVEHAHKFALEKFAADLLPVIDSLEKAVENAAAVTDGGPGSAIGEGVTLSLKLFQDVLEKSGLSRIDPVGEPFDPKLHEAITMIESHDAEPSSVLEVMQHGYTLNGRLVRAAMVVVSKAPAGDPVGDPGN